MPFDKRFAVVLFAALAIAAVCGWRVAANRPLDYAQQVQAARSERPVPTFEGLDAHNEMFRLERYLGRHRVLVVFFSAADTAAADPQLLAIRAVFPELERRDVKVVGVSTALPQQNRAAMEHAGEYPFPLVTDVDLTIHRRWGRLSAATNEPLSGTFLVDRKGSAPALGDQLRPVDNLAAVLKELTE